MAEPSERQSSLGSQMFRETALRKMSSADDLDHYLRLTNPSAWVLVGAVVALLAAAAIWACTATLPIRLTTTGVLKDGQIVCFLPRDENARANATSKVTAAGYDTSIVSIDDDPYSQREVEAVIGKDYTIASLNLSEWSYKVVVAPPEELSSWEEGDDIPISVTTREVTPMAALLGWERA